MPRVLVVVLVLLGWGAQAQAQHALTVSAVVAESVTSDPGDVTLRLTARGLELQATGAAGAASGTKLLQRTFVTAASAAASAAQGSVERVWIAGDGGARLESRAVTDTPSLPAGAVVQGEWTGVLAGSGGLLVTRVVAADS
jgi:hypothetical protein